MNVAGKRVLIVGVSGFIGMPLAAALSKAGAYVYGVSRNLPNIDDIEWNWVRGDASLQESVDVIFKLRPDIVYLLTSDSKGGRELDLVLPSLRNDVDATVNVLAAAARFGCERFIMAASLEEPTGPAETATPNSPYAAAKYATAGYARMFHKHYKLPVVQLRPFMGFGPRQKPYKVIPYTILSLLKGESTKIGSSDRKVDWIFIDDIVEAFVKAATNPNVVGETIDVGSGALVSIGQVTRWIADRINPQLLELGTAASRGEEIVRIADVDKAVRLLDWRQQTLLVDGLQKTIDWYQQHLGEFR